MDLINQENWQDVHRELSRQCAEEGIVLLKNDEFFPLKKQEQIALFGGGAVYTIKGGVGSGDVPCKQVVSLWQGLAAAGCNIVSTEWLRDYEQIFQQAVAEKQAEIQTIRDQHYGEIPLEMLFPSMQFTYPHGRAVNAEDVAGVQKVIYVISRNSGEGIDRQEEKGDYYLTDEEWQDLRLLCSLPLKTAVVLNVGGPIDLRMMDDLMPAALMLISQPGMEGGNAFARVAMGKVSPSGKLTDTWATCYTDYPSSMTYGKNRSNPLQDCYTEGIYVGYRYFDTFHKTPRYCFGYGLSYTQFEITVKDVRLEHPTSDSSRVALSLCVKNIGTCYTGKEVIQVYAILPQKGLPKEYKRLCAFQKTEDLAPGTQCTVTLFFSPTCLTSYSEKDSAYILDEGYYHLAVGNSSEHTQICAQLYVKEHILASQVRLICPMQQSFPPLNAPQQPTVLPNGNIILPLEQKDIPTAHHKYCYAEGACDESQKEVQIASTLTDCQLIQMVVGKPLDKSVVGAAGNIVPGSAGQTSDVLCDTKAAIPEMVMADGPAGLRLELDDTPCTAFPVGTMLAQTWNLALAEKVGQAISVEMTATGIHLWLAPGMNLHRNPLCGRNFEYYSEDPLVAGKMAAAIVRGVQSNPKTGAAIKHFACNNAEENRAALDCIVSERALRELYLRSFEIAVKESQPLAVMSAYNLINGKHAANSSDLLSDVLRDEWKFEGMVITDWLTTMPLMGPGTASIPHECIHAGNDLIMPGMVSDQEELYQAILNKTLNRTALIRCAARVIAVILRTRMD